MSKRRTVGFYNDFLDGEKLRDNACVETSLCKEGPGECNASPTLIHSGNDGSRPAKSRERKPPLTHFLCLPLVNEKSRPQLALGLRAIKEALQHDGTVPLEAVRPLGTLHLTLGVMCLDDAQMKAVKQYLQQLDIQALLRDIGTHVLEEGTAEAGSVSKNLGSTASPDTGALSVDLKSMMPMQRPHDTSVLYAEPRDTSHKLYPFGLALKDNFVKEGFLIKDERQLKLHATLVNTIHAKPRCRWRKQKAHAGHDSSASKSKRFDARILIERFKDFTWADGVPIDRVQICQMGAQKVLNDVGDLIDEQYKVIAEKLL